MDENENEGTDREEPGTMQKLPLFEPRHYFDYIYGSGTGG